MTNATHTQPVSTIACPAGFQASGMACGIKASGADDLALILCSSGAQVAAMFTRNLVKAAPVVIGQEKIALSRGREGLVLVGDHVFARAASGLGKSPFRRVVDHIEGHPQASAIIEVPL